MFKLLKEEIKQRIVTQHKELFTGKNIPEKEIPVLIKQILDEIVFKDKLNISEKEQKTIIAELVNEVIGFGQLESVLRDPEITEIMINGPDKIFIEKDGKKQLIDMSFESQSQLLNFVHRMLSPTRRHVDESNPFTDLSLKDGSRVNIIISPLAINGPVITIRKLAQGISTVEDLIRKGTMNKKIADFLVACIKAKANIIFSGATGAGKTTTLDALSSYISNKERIITIEDTAELSLNQDHVVRLEAKQPNIEGKGMISIRQLFVNSLRMRPDRIIIGEIRAAEALDMLQAICSGHTGSLAIIHGNSPRDIIFRIETMILSSGVPVNLESIHKQIAAAINLIVHQEQLLDGSRRITYVTQINGLKDDKAVLEDIFVFEQEDGSTEELVKGKWVATGVRPAFSHLFKKAGISVADELFNKE